ncbi:carbohydrate sulfotransferase 11-like [Oratosquilla oratoria]|uniref:carbohydrate sulfotransferase 11-like n=1 Tax=Oratosquilla oratoria TaxID=337810 RepID=UPI003F767457
MWVRVRLKTLMVVIALMVCTLLYSNVILPFVTSTTSSNSLHIHNEATRRVARIRSEDLAVVGRGLTGAFPDSSASASAAGHETVARVVAPAPPQVVENIRTEHSPEQCTGSNCSSAFVQPVIAPAPGGRDGLIQATSSVPRVTSAPHGLNMSNRSVIPARQINPCGRECRAAMYRDRRRTRGRYDFHVQVESVTLPDAWNLSPEVQNRLEHRRQRVQKVCKKYGFNKRTKENQPNAWEVLVNHEYKLGWCNVFKAASSSWMYNFNIMAGYTEKQLLASKDTPISLARKRYPRLSVAELDRIKNSENRTLFFLITRHPLHRLVSAFRDKLMGGKRFYTVLARNIIMHHGGATALAKAGRTPVPTFPQFVQYLLDEAAKGNPLDEHWVPVNTFCTPCLIDFDVYAKMETLEEDGNYVIFTTGIDHIIKPKRINRSRNEPTDAVAANFLCQLTSAQLEGLLQLYKYDMEMFEYEAEEYRNCTRNSVSS